MAKVSITLGVNVPLTEGAKFERFTPSASLEVDTDYNVAEQIKTGIAAMDDTWAALSDFIERKVFEETGVEHAMPK